MCKIFHLHPALDPVQVWASVFVSSLQEREGVAKDRRNGWSFLGSPVTPLQEQIRSLDITPAQNALNIWYGTHSAFLSQHKIRHTESTLHEPLPA